MLSTSGDTISTSGGYHEYIRGCSVYRGDIMSTSGDVHIKGLKNETWQPLLSENVVVQLFEKITYFNE